MERKVPAHEGEKFQLHIPATPTGRNQVFPKFPAGGHRFVLCKGFQSFHGLHREAEALGRGDRLHRRAGGHRADRRPGVLAEKFPKVVRGDAGMCIAGRQGEPPGHHPLLRTGKRKEHMDTPIVTTRVERVLPQRHGGPGKQGSPDTTQYAYHHQYGGIRRGESRRHGGTQADHHTGKRDRTQGV